MYLFPESSSCCSIRIITNSTIELRHTLFYTCRIFGNVDGNAAKYCTVRRRNHSNYVHNKVVVIIVFSLKKTLQFADVCRVHVPCKKLPAQASIKKACFILCHKYLVIHNVYVESLA